MGDASSSRPGRTTRSTTPAWCRSTARYYAAAGWLRTHRSTSPARPSQTPTGADRSAERERPVAGCRTRHDPRAGEPHQPDGATDLATGRSSSRRTRIRLQPVTHDPPGVEHRRHLAATPPRLAGSRPSDDAHRAATTRRSCRSPPGRASVQSPATIVRTAPDSDSPDRPSPRRTAAGRRRDHDRRHRRPLPHPKRPPPDVAAAGTRCSAPTQFNYQLHRQHPRRARPRYLMVFWYALPDAGRGHRRGPGVEHEPGVELGAARRDLAAVQLQQIVNWAFPLELAPPSPADRRAEHRSLTLPPGPPGGSVASGPIA